MTKKQHTQQSKHLPAHLPHKPHHFLTGKVITMIVIFLTLAVLSLISVNYLRLRDENNISPKTPETAHVLTPTTSPLNPQPPAVSSGTYQSNQYGFSLTIPEGWYFLEEIVDGGDRPDLLTLYVSDTDKIQYTDYKIQLSVVPKAYVTDKRALSFSDASSRSYPEITEEGFLGRTITKVFSEDFHGDEKVGDSYHVIIPLTQQALTMYSDIKHTSTVNQILMSLKFLTPTPSPSNSPLSEPVFCTMDAKICPDGSSVGRVPPTCEFAACPMN